MAIRKSRSGRRRRGGRIWPWLGLGALGAATLWLARRPAPAAARKPPVLPENAAPALGELPDDAVVSWISAPSGSLRVVERHPDGRLPVVFLHGLGGRLEHWTHQLHAVGPALRAIAFDLPGHGASDVPMDGDCSVPAMTAALTAVMEGFGLRRAVLMAHSLGALAAIDYAGTRSARVTGLFLVDPSGDQSRTGAEEVIDDPRGDCEVNFRHLLADADEAVREEVMSALSSTPDEVLSSALAGAYAYSPIPALERYVGSPQGGKIRSVVSDFNDLPMSLHRLHPDLPVRFIPHAGHWLMMERGDEVLEAFWDFLEDVTWD